MNKMKEFKSLQDVYFKNVLLKENITKDDSIKKLIEILNNNREKIENKYFEIFNKLEPELEGVEDVIEDSPEAFSDLRNIENAIDDSSEEVIESYLEERIGSRIASNIGTIKDFIKGEKTSTGDSDYQSLRVNRRFQIFQKKIGSHLKELQRDLETTSNADVSVKKQIDQMIDTLEKDYSIKPTESKFRDFTHSLGKKVEFGLQAIPLFAAGVGAGSLLAGAAGIVGIPALLLKGALAGALRKVAMDVIDGKKPKPNEVLKQAALAAVIATIGGVSIDYVLNNMNTIQTELKLSPPDLKPDDYFKDYHGNGGFDSLSDLDQSKLKFDSVLDAKNIKGVGEWSDTPSPAIVNAASSLDFSPQDYVKAADIIDKLKPEDIANIKNQITSAYNSGGQGQAEEKAAELLKKIISLK